MSPIAGVLLIVLLILVNAFFVAAEFAIVKSRATRMKALADDGRRLARLATPIIDQVESYLPVIQLGVTMATLALGWIGEPVLVRLVENPLRWVGVTTPALATGVAAMVAFVLITVAVIVLGELVPKSIAIRKAESTTMAFALPLRAFFWLFWPLVWVLTKLTNAILHLLRVEPASALDLAPSEEELDMMLIASHEGGHIDEVEQSIMKRALNLGDRAVGDIVVPRPETAALPADMPVSAAMEEIAVSNHTRYPVYEDDLDDAIGYVHVKDLYRTSPEKTVRSVLRPIGFIAETASIAAALQRFQSTRTPLAVVVDEHGGTSGIVTLQDVVEELIGEVQDEFDHEAPLIESLDEGSYSVDGAARIDFLSEGIGLQVPDEGFPTLGGRVFEQIQRRPRVGDEVVVGAFQARVLAVDGMRIARVLLSPVNPDTTDEGAG
jgi:CBS domain containing-hemolysin-like protein